MEFLVVLSLWLIGYSQGSVIYSYKGNSNDCYFQVTTVVDGTSSTYNYSWSSTEIFETEMTWCLSRNNNPAVMYFINYRNCSNPAQDWELNGGCGCPICTKGSANQEYDRTYITQHIPGIDQEQQVGGYDETRCYECTADSSGKWDTCTITATYERDFENIACPPLTCTDGGNTYTYGDVWFGSDTNSECKYICTCIANDQNQGEKLCVNDAITDGISTTSALWDPFWDLCSGTMEGCRGSSSSWTWGSDTCDGSKNSPGNCPSCSCTADTTPVYSTDDGVYTTCVDCECDGSMELNCEDQWSFAKASGSASDSDCTGPISCYNLYESNVPQNATRFTGCAPDSDAWCGAFTSFIVGNDGAGGVETSTLGTWGCMNDFLCGSSGIITSAGCARANLSIPVWAPDCDDYTSSSKTDTEFVAAMSCSSGTLSNYYDLDTCTGNVQQQINESITEAPCYVWDNVDMIGGQTCTGNNDLSNFWDSYYSCVHSKTFSTGAYQIGEFCGDKPNRASRCDYIASKALVEIGCLCYAGSNMGAGLYDNSGWDEYYNWKNAEVLADKDKYECDDLNWECYAPDYGFFRYWRTNYAVVTFKFDSNTPTKAQISNYANVPYNSIELDGNDCTIRFDTNDDMDNFYGALTDGIFGWDISDADKSTDSYSYTYQGTNTTEGDTPVPTPSPTSIIATTGNANTHVPLICFAVAILRLLF